MIAGSLRNISKYGGVVAYKVHWSLYVLLHWLWGEICKVIYASQTYGAKVLRQEGNSPEHNIRCPKIANFEGFIL